eukprot:6616035-Alexandrium_andersonii.AAC.1
MALRPGCTPLPGRGERGGPSGPVLLVQLPLGDWAGRWARPPAPSRSPRSWPKPSASPGRQGRGP